MSVSLFFAFFHIFSSIWTWVERTGFLAQYTFLFPKHTLLSLYNTLLLPYLNYGNIVRGNCCKTKLDSILLLQKKAVRICSHSSFLEHADPLFNKLKVLKIHDINEMQTAIFMFKHAKNVLPSNFANFFLLIIRTSIIIPHEHVIIFI